MNPTARLFRSCQGLAVALLVVSMARSSPAQAAAARSATESRAGELLSAAQAGDRQSVAALLESGVSANSVAADGTNALLLASQSGHADVVKLLLSHAADPNARGPRGVTPLSQACFAGHTGVAVLLLDRGANIDTVDEDGASSLYLAVQEEHLETVRELLSRGAQVDRPDRDGVAALHRAAKNGDREAVELLLTAGADQSLKTKAGETALMTAVVTNRPEVVELLLVAGSNVDDRKSGESCLHAESRKGYESVVVALLAARPDVNRQTMAGQTPLFSAVQAEHEGIVRLLLDAGANPDTPALGETPLMMAAKDGNLSLVTMLVAANANVNSRDPQGATALDVAEALKRVDVAEVLRAAGAKATTAQERSGARAAFSRGASDNAEPAPADDYERLAVCTGTLSVVIGQLRALRELGQASPEQQRFEEGLRDAALDSARLASDHLVDSRFSELSQSGFRKAVALFQSDVDAGSESVADCARTLKRTLQRMGVYND